MVTSPEKPKLPSPLPAPSVHAPSPGLPVTTKRSLLALFALAAYIAWSFGAWEAVLQKTSIRPRLRPAILLVGDSLTEKGTIPKTNGWVTLLQSDYRRSVNVVPRGLSGYNTRYARSAEVPVIAGEISSGAYTPALITIWLGANDAALPNGSAVAQHVPIDDYKGNLVKLVHAFKGMAPGAKILLITPPLVDDEVQQTHSERYQGAMKGVVVHSNKMAGMYARACVDTATVLGLPVLDLHTYFNNLTDWTRKHVLEDGLHLNLKGNNYMYEQLRKKIDVEFPNFAHKFERWQIPSYEKWVDSDPWVPEATNSTPAN
ncbi:unnamed protein product [Phytophthora fragariaefolia]|uniref:Unnamed protein product n=1 Tax=Phytophthora fragariaefolia TaxID=1490495 RepID=A0A9W6XRH0_9STRA|nr:unnamed protein product [Phytophthora fragariaefolia]